MSGHVRVVGTGLIGTSLGIALRRAGFRVTLSDQSPTAALLTLWGAVAQEAVG